MRLDLRDAEKEIERLQQRNADLAETVRTQEIRLHGYRLIAESRRIGTVIDEFDSLVGALEFYAEEANYDYDDDFPERINLVTFDGGAKARAVLKAVDDGGME